MSMISILECTEPSFPIMENSEILMRLHDQESLLWLSKLGMRNWEMMFSEHIG